MSDSFPDLGQRIVDLAQPSRIDVVRAKKHILGQLCDGRPHGADELVGAIADLFGADPLRHPAVELPSRDSVHSVVTANHAVVLSIRADVIAREALAELAAQGMLIAAGGPGLPGSAALQVGYKLPSAGAATTVPLQRPAVLSDVVQLPHRLREAGLWHAEPDVLTEDLASLGLDPRTLRSLREAVESYRRGVFLAAASLLGAAVEGAWYAAGQQLRATVPEVNQLVDGDRTARLQAAVATALRSKLPNNRAHEADSLSQFARLMRDIRNYGVHPRQHSDGRIEIYFEEDRCGLLFLEARRHLEQLATTIAETA